MHPLQSTAAKKIFCNRCGTSTIHSWVASVYPSVVEPVEGDPSDGPAECSFWRMWKCLGCDTALLEEVFAFLQFDDDGELLLTIDEGIYDARYVPERSAFIVQQKQFINLPMRLEEIYRETLHAYNNNLDMLCAIGIRTLIEGICADQEIAGKNLQAKIEGLSSILPRNIVSNLHNLRFMGNEAAHELQSSDRNELHLAIEICEDLLNFIYELDYRATQLAKSRQTRHSDSDISTSESDTEEQG